VLIPASRRAGDARFRQARKSGGDARLRPAPAASRSATRATAIRVLARRRDLERLLKRVTDMTISRPSVTLVVLALLSTPAFAEGEGNPADAVENVDAPKPKIISSGQDGRGFHAFLAVSPKGPQVFWGPKEDLAELDVLSMQRIKDGFVIDTLEEGEIIFETGRTPRVIKRGTPGFNGRPTLVMSHAVDAGLREHLGRQLGGTAPKSSVAVEVTADASHVRFPAARSTGPGHSQGGVYAHHKATPIKAQSKRVRAQARVRGRVR
jgi:hypothetical protein